MLCMKASAFRFLLSAFLLAFSFSANARTYLVSVGIADYLGFATKINNLSLTTTAKELFSFVHQGCHKYLWQTTSSNVGKI